MPELPDIFVLANSMNAALQTKVITDAQVNQPKCLNVSTIKFKKYIKRRRIESIRQRGKWILGQLDTNWILAFNLGMGGEIRLHNRDERPDAERERVVLILDTGEQVWIHHWWFGHVHLLQSKDLANHKQLSKLGLEPLDDTFTVEKFSEMLRGKRGRIKSYLLDQSFIAGIGNVYVQDTLWYARLHPNRTANTLTHEEIKALHSAIQHVLKQGIRFGGGPGEQDIWGNPGMYSKHLQVGYKTGKACPRCKSIIEELRVGSTTSYICPKCQL
ncbi:MAG: bifunctional DNA-formamidopyrimidine glycosylase/DNA-(apurinic or apyrimidinic site) lyase [Candidatus Thorarchaeota archaeon]|nr:bifunctional DNA-formamidopyrimidine glycosylase/DNA-(apurinic or apyrimidinic site) lyase [Candidatus Thorarchaeota archaeon]